MRKSPAHVHTRMDVAGTRITCTPPQTSPQMEFGGFARDFPSQGWRPGDGFDTSEGRAATRTINNEQEEKRAKV